MRVSTARNLKIGDRLLQNVNGQKTKGVVQATSPGAVTILWRGRDPAVHVRFTETLYWRYITRRPNAKPMTDQEKEVLQGIMARKKGPTLKSLTPTDLIMGIDVMKEREGGEGKTLPLKQLDSSRYQRRRARGFRKEPRWRYYTGLFCCWLRVPDWWVPTLKQFLPYHTVNIARYCGPDQPNVVATEEAFDFPTCRKLLEVMNLANKKLLKDLSEYKCPV